MRDLYNSTMEFDIEGNTLVKGNDSSSVKCVSTSDIKKRSTPLRTAA